MNETIDANSVGLNDEASTRRALHGLLQHLSRIGVTVLPAAQTQIPILSRITFGNQENTAEQQPQIAAAETVSTQSIANNEIPLLERGPVLGASVDDSALASRQRDYSLPLLQPIQRQKLLAELQAQVADCRACPELVVARNTTVFGEGAIQPRICFFGEAPGADEDLSGRPFVGKAGQLLTKMIEACTFRRDDCYILNTIKCRPPGNRNPFPLEVQNCRGFFEQQLEILQPQYIVCLGLVAARALLDTTSSVGQLRGSFHRYKSSKVVVTYHPSYLLRTPDAKRAAWDDLQMMLRDMGIDPKSGR